MQEVWGCATAGSGTAVSADGLKGDCLPGGDPVPAPDPVVPFPVKATGIMPSLHRRRQSGAPGSRR